MIRRLVPSTPKGRALALGLLMLAGGLLFAWPPLALIVPGALLVVFAIFTPAQGPEGEA